MALPGYHFYANLLLRERLTVHGRGSSGRRQIGKESLEKPGAAQERAKEAVNGSEDAVEVDVAEDVGDEFEDTFEQLFNRGEDDGEVLVEVFEEVVLVVSAVLGGREMRQTKG